MSGPTAAGRYSQLEALRSPFLKRARDCAKVTIPALLPPEGHSYAQDLYVPFQSLGARGVNNLASKLLLTLLPPNQPFFKLEIDDFTREKLTGSKEMEGRVSLALNKIERTVQAEIEIQAMRPVVFETKKLLLVSGNAFLLELPTGGYRVFKLTDYVVKRDPSGNVLEAITKEAISPAALPKELAEIVRVQNGDRPLSAENTVDLYTWFRRKAQQWVVSQELNGIMVPGSQGQYPLDAAPFLALRYTRIDGEDYGRGHVEEYLGDLYSLEGLSQAIVEGAASAAKVLIMVKPGGPTSQRALAEAPNGAIISGDRDDVGVLQLDKYADFRVAREQAKEIEQRLAFAFLLNTAIQRQGERVTAEEIRYMASELEDALGGVYSVLSQEFQLPLVNRLMRRLERAGRLPPLPKKMVRPSIITGMDALGRGHDLNRLTAGLKTLQEVLGPEVMVRYVKPGEVANRVFASVGVSTEGLLFTDEEIAAREQQAQMQAMVDKLGPNAITQMGSMASKSMETNEQPVQAAGPGQ